MLNVNPHARTHSVCPMSFPLFTATRFDRIQPCGEPLPASPAQVSILAPLALRFSALSSHQLRIPFVQQSSCNSPVVFSLHVPSCLPQATLTLRLLMSYIYRVSQEECEILREFVPYVKLYRYNPKHLYPKLRR